jgi:ATP-dependent DNA helicase RecQ
MLDIFTTASAIPRFWVAINQDQAERYLKKLTSITNGLKNISLEFKDDNFYPTDTPSVQLLTAVIDKILSRGNPTFINLKFEEQLTSKLKILGMNFVDLNDYTGSREIGFGLDTNTTLDIEGILESAQNISYKNFSKKLIDNTINDALKIEDKGLSSPSEENFYSHIGDVFSKDFQSQFMRQASITDLIGKENELVKNGKVDFAIEYKSQRYVIEIDGEDHTTDEGIAEHDTMRDAVLNDNGWQVIRINNDEVDDLNSEHYKTIKEEIFNDFRANVEGLDLKSKEAKAAMLSVILPQLVHRATKAINELIQNQQFPDSDEANILIVEEDIPVMLCALENYYEIALELCNVSEFFHKLPKLNIDYMGDTPFVKVEGNDYFSIKNVKKVKKEYDLIINHSATARTGISGNKENNLKRIKSKYWVRLRSSKCHKENRAMLWSPPAKYDLKQFEDALRSQGTDDPLPIPKKIHKSLKYFLKTVFRKNEFWDGQLMVITRLLQGKNTIVLLPTGGGKSLTYQFSGLLQPGTALIIDPLVALINDQVANLNQMGFDRAGYISSLLDASEREIELQKVAKGSYYYVFVAPERMQMENFRSQLRALVAKFPISLAVIDEAHCVSEWGHDFRPSYLHLGLNINKYCSVDGDAPPPIVGLTGTASFAVLTDIQIELDIKEEEAVILPRSFDREEISFKVTCVPARDKSAELQIIIDRLPRDFQKNPQTFFELKGDKTNCGIIFAMHAGVRSSLGAPKIAYMRGHNNFYTGKADTETKIQTQDDFKKNRIQEIVATKAFGMGIDKPNIAYTIHYSIPHSVEAFYQEAGRAGRNGVEGSAISYVIYSNDNYELIEQIVDSPDHEEALKIMKQVGWDDKGDLLHQFWLLFQSYKNREIEKENIYDIWQSELLPKITGLPQGSTNTAQINFDGDERSDKEKSIFRLVQLGIISDYDVDWQHRCFNLRVTSITPKDIQLNLKNFLERYKFAEFAEIISEDLDTDDLESAIEDSISRMVDFVYDELVSKRKRAMLTMADICNNFQSNEQFKESILNYLQESEFTEELRGWVNTPFDDIGMESIEDIINGIEDHEESRRLVGTVRRMLDEDPDNFALMMLSVVARSRSAIEVDESVLFEINRFVNKLIKFEDQEITGRLLLLIVNELVDFRTTIADEVIKTILRLHGSQEFVSSVLTDHRFGLNEETIQNLVTVLLANTFTTVVENSYYNSLTERGVKHG